MKACLLHSPARVETSPLEYTDAPVPDAQADEVLVRVAACGVCRTDLHVVEGELPPRKSPVIPGHQVVGRIDKAGPEVSRFSAGDEWAFHGFIAPAVCVCIAVRERRIF